MITFNENRYQSKQIAEGGEGRIYDYQNQIIKIFKDNVDKKEKLIKATNLMNLSLPKSVISPIDLVYDMRGQFSGYLMNKIQGEELNMIASKKFIKSNNITKKDILVLLMKIKNTILDLHEQNIFIGDLNDCNVLFDNDNVFFIDVDSWSIGKYKCTVANESFKDPNLISNFFNEGTDVYAFGIMVYKMLTRLHPFGGILQSHPNMNLFDRMEKGLTVIDNKNVKIPRMVDKDIFISRRLLDQLKTIFTTKNRKPIDTNLDDFNNNLTLCNTHNDYFYSRFNKCPVCESDAKEMKEYVKIGSEGGIPIHVTFSKDDIKLIFNEDVYLTNDNVVTFRNTTKTFKFRKGLYYEINDKGDVFYKTFRSKIQIKTPKKLFELEKKFKTNVVIRNNDVYYISNNLSLNQFSLVDHATSTITKINDVFINCVFDVINPKTYFVCHSLDHKKIIDVSGVYRNFENKDKIVQSTIQYDHSTKSWLFIFETSKGNFITMIYDKDRGERFFRDDIRYLGNIKNICYHNGLIYKPADKAIVRFNYKTNEYKEFKVPVISSDTKLIKVDKKFVAIDEQKIYLIG